MKITGFKPDSGKRVQSGSGEESVVLKPTTQHLAQETSLKPIQGLGLKLKEGRSYLIRALLFLATEDGTMGAKVGFTVPDGTDLAQFRIKLSDGVTPATVKDQLQLADGDLEGALPAGEHFAEFEGYIQNASAGDFQLSFAQRTSSSGNLSVYAGSKIEVTEIR